MRVLDEICDGRHSPVLPVRVRDEKGELIESRSRFALVRRDDGLSDVVFYPVLESSPLERYDEAQQKQLLAGKAILADVETADGRHSKAFVQIDEETKQVMYIPTPIIGRNLQVLADIMHLGTMEVNSMQNGEPLTLVVDDEPVTVGIDLHDKTGIRFCSGDSQKWMTATSTMFPKRNIPKNCGTNRRKAPSVTVRREFTNNILTSSEYGRTPILFRRGTYREDGARRIRLARLCESFLARMAGGICPLLQGAQPYGGQRIRRRVRPLQGRATGGGDGERRCITETLFNNGLWRYERIPTPE